MATGFGLNTIDSQAGLKEESEDLFGLGLDLKAHQATPTGAAFRAFLMKPWGPPFGTKAGLPWLPL